MVHAPAAGLVLRDGDEEELRRLVRSSSVRARLAQRARIVLLAAEGVANMPSTSKCPTIVNKSTPDSATGLHSKPPTSTSKTPQPQHRTVKVAVR